MGRRQRDLKRRIIEVANADPRATNVAIAQRVDCHPSTVAKHLKGRRRPSIAAAGAASDVTLRPGEAAEPFEEPERPKLTERIADRLGRASPLTQNAIMSMAFPAVAAPLLGAIAAIPPAPGSAIQSPGVLEGAGYGALGGLGMSAFYLLITLAPTLMARDEWKRERARARREAIAARPDGPSGPSL